MQNPFNPAPGALPERIIGRESELAAIGEAVRRAESGSAPLPLIFLGQRGMGKTVLLRTLRDRGARKTVALAVEVLPDRSFAQSIREKIESVMATVETLPTRVARTLEKTLQNIPKMSYELPYDMGAIALSAREGHIETQTLSALLGALQVAAIGAKRFLTITIDEVQDADVAAMQTLVRVVHESAQSPAPILLACAGLSESYLLFEKMRTYVQRWDTFELRLLSSAETVEAFREPILAENSTIDDAALDRLVSESGGYPFFIQVYGSAVWEAHRARHITLADVEASIPSVRARNEINFYVRPLARMSARETLFALALADLGAGTHESGAVARSLGATPPNVSSIRTTLARKGIVAAPIPGKVEFRIPFTDRYLREHRADYETPEVITYRQRFAERLNRKA